MYFALTDDQRSLADAVREFLADRFDLSAVRAGYDDPAGDGDPSELWKAIGEQGWLAVLVPEQHDGLGLGVLEAAVVVRRFGAGVIPGPYLATLVAAEAIRLAGDDAQRAAWLPRVAGGEVKLALACRAEGERWDASGVGVTLGDDGRLTGDAAFVEYAAAADRLVVAARTADEVALLLVDPATTGVTITGVDALDRTTRLAHVAFDHAEGERLGHGSAAVLDDVLDRAAVLYANDLVGLAREALDRTVRYDTERTQFGRPVGSFQALKHMLADLHVGVVMAEHAALYAAHALDEDLPDARLMVSVAKAKASDVARDVTAAMIQLHGGIGFTWEHDAHFFFKRAKREEYAYGDAVEHRERIARLTIDAC